MFHRYFFKFFFYYCQGIHFIVLFLFISFPEFSGYALYHGTSQDKNQDSPPVWQWPRFMESQLHHTFIFCLISALSLLCRPFWPSLLAFEVADCISAGECRHRAASKGRGQGHSTSSKDALRDLACLHFCPLMSRRASGCEGCIRRLPKDQSKFFTLSLQQPRVGAPFWCISRRAGISCCCCSSLPVQAEMIPTHFSHQNWWPSCTNVNGCTINSGKR